MQGSDLAMDIKLTEKDFPVKVCHYYCAGDCDWCKFATESDV